MSACAGAVIIQLIALVYDPRAQVPSAADRSAVRDVIATLDRYPGPVYMATHPLYSYLRDGTIHAHAMGFNDIGALPGLKLGSAEFLKREFGTVAVDTHGRYPPGIKHHYNQVHNFKLEGATLQPRTGFKARPASIYVRRDHAP